MRKISNIKEGKEIANNKLYCEFMRDNFGSEYLTYNELEKINCFLIRLALEYNISGMLYVVKVEDVIDYAKKIKDTINDLLEESIRIMTINSKLPSDQHIIKD